MRGDRTSFWIKVAVVLAAMPRWIPALMIADGYPMPAAWHSWWIPFSALANTAMAVIEGIAIAYMFGAWQTARGKEANRLLSLTIIVLITFTIVLIPYVTASAAGVEMQVVINNPTQYGMALLWSSAVVLSTGFTIMAVGIAQGVRERKQERSKYLCWCGYEAEDEDDFLDHQDEHAEEVSGFESAQAAVNFLEKKYTPKREEILPSMPKLVEVARMMNNSNEKEEE